jgi:ribosomal subunit interface protein
MQISVKGKQIDVGESLRQHVETELAAIAEKFAGRPIEGHAVFSREAHLINCELSVHFGRGLVVQSAGAATAPYASFDQALERAAKRLRRYKRRLRDHWHGRDREPAGETLAARTYLLAPPGDDLVDTVPVSDAPVIVAELATEIPMLSVSEAVMRMDLADLPTFVFRNRKNGGLNVVYRRHDGNIGWVDPDLAGSREPVQSS